MMLVEVYIGNNDIDVSRREAILQPQPPTPPCLVGFFLRLHNAAHSIFSA